MGDVIEQFIGIGIEQLLGGYSFSLLPSQNKTRLGFASRGVFNESKKSFGLCTLPYRTLEDLGRGGREREFGKYISRSRVLIASLLFTVYSPCEPTWVHVLINSPMPPKPCLCCMRPPGLSEPLVKKRKKSRRREKTRESRPSSTTFPKLPNQTLPKHWPPGEKESLTRLKLI